MLSRFSCVQLFATSWTVARLSPRALGFSSQEYWSGLPFPVLGDLPDLGIKLTSLMSPCVGRWVLYHEHHLGMLVIGYCYYSYFPDEGIGDKVSSFVTSGYA